MMGQHVTDKDRDRQFEVEVAKVLQRRLIDGTNIESMERDGNTVIWTTSTDRAVYIIVEAEKQP